MRPTDEQINRRMAEVLGYSVYHYDKGHEDYWMLCAPDDLYSMVERKSEAEAWVDAPNFCDDRNALPEIWNELERDGRPIQAWNYFIHLLLPRRRVSLRGAWYILQSSPRRQVIAALKALNEWPDEWEGSE